MNTPLNVQQVPDITLPCDECGAHPYEPCHWYCSMIQDQFDYEPPATGQFRCEDYPCCGHTDGLGCDYDTSFYSSPAYYNFIQLHYGCDHDAGWCAAHEDA